MKIVICIDDKDGLLFCGRRQSKDRLLRQRLLKGTQGSKLWMSSYSAKQFEETGEQICVDDDFMEKAESGDYCFVENTDILPHLSKITEVILYHWNRTYPSDVKLPRAELEAKWQKVSTAEFPGSSHDVITEEVYVL